MFLLETTRRRFCAGWSLYVLVLTLGAMTGVSPLHAQDSPAVLAREAEQRIRALQAEADRLAGETRTLLGQLRTLELERAIKGQAVRKADAAVAEVSAALAASTARVAALEAERVASTAGVQERLVEIYKRGRSGYVRLLLASDDLQGLGRMTRGVTAVAALDRLRIDEHRRTIRAAEQATAELEAQKRALDAARVEARASRAALDAAVAAHTARLDALDRERDLAAQYVGELQAAAHRIAERVDGLSHTTAALPLAPFRGALEWPVEGGLVSPFGRGSHRGRAIDRSGIEIAASAGREVRAVHGGVVSFAAPFVGFGTLVIVDHGDNAFSVYGHLQEATVTPGSRLDKGSVVGRAGRNPEGIEAVYFELRIDGRAVNPVQWLQARRAPGP